MTTRMIDFPRATLAPRSPAEARARQIAMIAEVWDIVLPRAEAGSEKALQQLLCLYEQHVRVAGFRSGLPMARAISRLIAARGARSADRRGA